MSLPQIYPATAGTFLTNCPAPLPPNLLSWFKIHLKCCFLYDSSARCSVFTVSTFWVPSGICFFFIFFLLFLKNVFTILTFNMPYLYPLPHKYLLHSFFSFYCHPSSLSLFFASYLSPNTCYKPATDQYSAAGTKMTDH